MLDDLKLIHERDAQDALGIAEKEAGQLTAPIALTGALVPTDFLNVVYAGMGGSALAATMVHTWPVLRVPFEVVRDYDVPFYMGEQTLFIAASYSGNTEETLSALAQAEAKGAKIAVIAGGGELERIAIEKGYYFAKLSKFSQPRFAVFANYRALLQILEAASVANVEWIELDQAAQHLSSAVQAWLPTVPTKDNPAKQIALDVIGKSAVVYAGPKLFPAAYKWKISFNENAKHVAWCGQYSEFNHNEFIGWSKQPVDKPYAVIDIRSNLEHPQIQKRFVLSERLLSGLRPAPIVVRPEGETLLDHLTWAITLGDFVTLYTAILNGLNPTPVDLIERFKREL